MSKEKTTKTSAQKISSATPSSNTLQDTNLQLHTKLELALGNIHDFDSFGRAVYQEAMIEALSKLNAGVDFSNGPVEIGLRIKVDISTDKATTGNWVIVVGSDGTARTVFCPR